MNKFSYWGVDGCSCGWLCVGLNNDDDCHCFVAPDIECADEKLKELGAKIALIDVPIGLPNGKTERQCDQDARNYIRGKFRSVYSVPCREALEAYKSGADTKDKERRGRKTSEKKARGPLTHQIWKIADKIVEVDDFMQGNKDALFYEVHSEVCFRALNQKQPLAFAKDEKHGGGIEERLAILRKYMEGLQKHYHKIRGRHLKTVVTNDDIVDAFVAAITARLGYPNNFQTLPEDPPRDAANLPMQMLYYIETDSA